MPIQLLPESFTYRLVIWGLFCAYLCLFFVCFVFFFFFFFCLFLIIFWQQTMTTIETFQIASNPFQIYNSVVKILYKLPSPVTARSENYWKETARNECHPFAVLHKRWSGLDAVWLWSVGTFPINVYLSTDVAFPHSNYEG